jgi:hypothetical protein
MTLEQFRDLAEIWGGDVERWPQAQQSAARAIAATAAGAEVLDEARRLDRLLAVSPAVSEERAAAAAFAVVQHIATDGERRWWLQWRRGWLLPGASLACSAAVGVALAISVPYEGPQQGAALVLGLILDSGSMAAGWVLQ